MKSALRLLVRFLAWSALALLAASTLTVAHGYVTGYDPAGTSVAVSFLPRLLHALSYAWVPAVLVAGLIALFSAARGGTGAVSGLAALWGAWTTLLLAGGFLLAVVPEPIPPGVSLPPRALVRVEPHRVYALRRVGNAYGPIVVHDAGATRDTRFSVVPEGRVDPVPGLLELDRADESAIDLRNATNSYPAMVRRPGLTANLAADVTNLRTLLTAVDGNRLPALLNLVALSVFLLACWTLVRLSRWPLFNALFAIAALRLAIWVIPAVQRGSLRGMLIAAFDSTVLPFASAAILAILALGLFAVLVFLPPLDDWRGEVADG